MQCFWGARLFLNLTQATSKLDFEPVRRLGKKVVGRADANGPKIYRPFRAVQRECRGYIDRLQFKVKDLSGSRLYLHRSFESGIGYFGPEVYADARRRPPPAKAINSQRLSDRLLSPRRREICIGQLREYAARDGFEITGAPCLIDGTHEIGSDCLLSADQLFAVDLQVAIGFPILVIGDFSADNTVGIHFTGFEELLNMLVTCLARTNSDSFRLTGASWRNLTTIVRRGEWCAAGGQIGGLGPFFMGTRQNARVIPQVFSRSIPR